MAEPTIAHDTLTGANLHINKMASGTYTGDGGSTQAITGLGFQPRMVIIYRQLTGNYGIIIKSSGDTGLYSGVIGIGPWDYSEDMILSLDADGFTVGDNAVVNGNGSVFTYVAFA